MHGGEPCGDAATQRLVEPNGAPALRWDFGRWRGERHRRIHQDTRRHAPLITDDERSPKGSFGNLSLIEEPLIHPAKVPILARPDRSACRSNPLGRRLSGGAAPGSECGSRCARETTGASGFS